MNRFIISLIIILFSLAASAQQKNTISGTITDAATGETLIGATILIKELPHTGTTCNDYGYYSITLPEGQYTLEVSFISFIKVVRSVNLNKNKKINIKLEDDTSVLDEVVISTEKKNENIVSEKMGVEQMKIRDIKKIPVLFGEQDIIKTLALTPGVKTTGNGNGGMFVRGGNNSQNLILLDEATVYNSSHLMGFFSTFNSDAIKDLTLYKGTAPAEYGGRTSSVMDIKMNEGNNQSYHVSGGIGIISSKLNIEGPIIKDKGSFLVNGRRTYADLFLRLSKDDNINKNKLYFYDLNAKANYKINDNNRIFISGYFGRDEVSFQEKFGIDWGNVTGTLRWNHIWNNKLFSNTSLIYSDYDYKVAITEGDDDFSLTSVIKNWNLKQDFQYYLNNKNTFTFGFNLQYQTITPGQIDVSEGSNIIPVELEDRFALDNALFFSNDWKPNNKLKITYGLRLSSFNLLGPGNFYSYNDDGKVTDTIAYKSREVVKTYLNLEPRINAAYILNESTSIKASYTRNTQNLHLIQNSNSSTPTDIWISSSNNIKPEISDQVAIGYFKNFKNNEYQFSGELYYRWMQNQIDLKNGAEIRANEFIEGELLFGSGRSYGMELMLKRKYKKLNGWISYTLSRTERQIEGINDNNWYPARQDATHDISVVGIYDHSNKWSFSATWVYNTGNAVTFPSGKYEIDGGVEFYYTERNGYRMPAYHRLDLAATKYIKRSDKFESSLSFSLYNAYGRKNAYAIDFETDADDSSRTIAVKTYLFTFIPSISYNFKF